MKNSLKALVLAPAVAGLLAAGFTAPAQAYTQPSYDLSAGKQIACTREYSPVRAELEKVMGRDSHRINALMTQAVNNNNKISLDFKFEQAFSKYGKKAGQLAYKYYKQSCWTI